MGTKWILLENKVTTDKCQMTNLQKLYNYKLVVHWQFLKKCSFLSETNWRWCWPSGRVLAGAGYNTLQASIQESSAWSLSLTLNAAAPGAPSNTPGYTHTHTHTAHRGRSEKNRNVMIPKIHISVTSYLLFSTQVTNQSKFPAQTHVGPQYDPDFKSSNFMKQKAVSEKICWNMLNADR